jgi:hypothetical protein
MARKRNRQRNRNRNKQMDPMAAPGLSEAAAQEEPQFQDEQETNVSPEEQAMYGKFMENYYRIMYDTGTQGGPKGEPPLIDEVKGMLSGIEDPVMALGTAASTVVSQLAQSAEAAGKPIPPDVLMHAGTEVVQDLAELSENAGIKAYSEDEMGKALQVGMSMYVSEHGGNQEAYKADMDAMMQAEKEGRIDELLPGISEVASRADKSGVTTSQPEPRQVVQNTPPPGLRRV